MKEATGEANLTVITIILVAVIVVIATPLINSLLRRQAWRSCCTDQGGVVNGTTCRIYENGEIVKTVSKDQIINENHACVQVETIG